MSHEEYKEMLVTHALGALGAEEERSLQAHLATCDECRAELDEWLGTAAALALAATPVEPPTELRARLFKAIRAGGARAENSGENGARETAAPRTNVVPFTQTPRPGAWSSGLKFAALAASVAFVALIIWLFILWNRNSVMRAEVNRLSERNNELQAEVARLSERNEQLQTEFASLSNRSNELQSEIARLAARGNARPPVTPSPAPRRGVERPFAEADMQVVALAGTKVAPGARATMTYDRRTGRATLTAYNLPPAPAGKDYQLWFIIGGKPVSGGVFRTDAAGAARMNARLPTDGRNSAPVFAVTLEPRGGVSAPTGEKYLLSSTS